MNKTILLTFDVEEFDGFGGISGEDRFEISKEGLLKILKLLDEYKIKATFFTTAVFAMRYPGLVRKLIGEGHEVVCHGYEHSDSYVDGVSFDKVRLAKSEIEKIIGCNVRGFRAPRFGINNSGISKLFGFGFSYDSSLHPTFIPGRYFKIFENRKVHKIGGVIEIPLSVLPFFRLPIFWLAFKNFGLNYAKMFTRVNFLFSDYTMLVFHPWEFADLSEYKLPFYVKRRGGLELLKMLEDYAGFCGGREFEFKTIGEWLEKRA